MSSQGSGHKGKKNQISVTTFIIQIGQLRIVSRKNFFAGRHKIVTERSVFLINFGRYCCSVYSKVMLHFGTKNEQNLSEWGLPIIQQKTFLTCFRRFSAKPKFFRLLSHSAHYQWRRFCAKPRRSPDLGLNL